MQKQDFFSKQQRNSGFSGGVIRQPQTPSRPKWIWILLLVLLLGGAGYWYRAALFTQDIPNEPSHESGYMIGSAVQKEGILKADGDVVTYTHTLTTSDGEKFLLKSTTLPLYNYLSSLSGTFQIW